MLTVSKRLENCKIMLTIDSIIFSPLVIALHANNLQMFWTNVVIAGAAFLIFASFTNIASMFLCLWQLVFVCSSPFSVGLRLNCTLYLH